MIHIALLGCGTVGAGVSGLVKQNAADIENRLGGGIHIKKVLARTPDKARALGFADSQICGDIDEILSDDDISVVVEVMGGTDTAFRYNAAAMAAGKHVVTANKDMVEQRWSELYELAAKNSVGFYYEGAVCGGVPVIHPIKTSLAANRIDGIVGILNGTSNYILTKMYRDGLDYAAALAGAQRHGFAESDPAADVGGYDAARKLTILSRLAYNTKISLDDMYIEGITGIEPVDISMAREMGYVIKLLAISRRTQQGVSACVRPAFVPLDHPIAGVEREFNAVLLHCDAAGDIMLYGKGAGAMPTASAVVGDVIVAARGVLEGRVRRPAAVCYDTLPVLPVGETINRYYLRMTVQDKPLVLAGISTALGKNGVSMASLVQRPHQDGTATLIIITHPALEKDLRNAIDELLAAESVGHVAALVCLPEQGGTPA